MGLTCPQYSSVWGCTSGSPISDLELVCVVVAHAQRLGDALPFVVAASRPDGVDVPPVLFGLGMHLGIADLGPRACVRGSSSCTATRRRASLRRSSFAARWG